MPEITSQIFRIEKKLTPEEISSLEVFNIVDMGGLPKDYFYHLRVEEVSDDAKKVLEEKFGLRFVETRIYNVDNRYPVY